MSDAPPSVLSTLHILAKAGLRIRAHQPATGGGDPKCLEKSDLVKGTPAFLGHNLYYARLRKIF